MKHSINLWFRQPSWKCVAAAVAHYKTSPNCNAVMQAVDAAFNPDGLDIFEDIEGNEQFRKAFGEKLIQIALSNKLCMSNSEQ